MHPYLAGGGMPLYKLLYHPYKRAGYGLPGQG